MSHPAVLEQEKSGYDDRDQTPRVPRQDSLSSKESEDPTVTPGSSALERGANEHDLPPALVAKEVQRTEAALGDAVLRFLRIRKGGPKYDPDAVSVLRMFGLVSADTGRLLLSLACGTRKRLTSLLICIFTLNGRISALSTPSSDGLGEKRRRSDARSTGKSW